MQTQLAGFAACQECRKARRSRIVLDKRQNLPNHHAAEKRKPGSLKKCKQRDLFQHLGGRRYCGNLLRKQPETLFRLLFVVWKLCTGLAVLTSQLRCVFQAAYYRVWLWAVCWLSCVGRILVSDISRCCPNAAPAAGCRIRVSDLVYRNFRIIATNRRRRPHPTKANNRCVAQGAVGQPIDTTGQLPDNTTECKAGL